MNSRPYYLNDESDRYSSNPHCVPQFEAKKPTPIPNIHLNTVSDSTNRTSSRSRNLECHGSHDSTGTINGCTHYGTAPIRTTYHPDMLSWHIPGQAPWIEGENTGSFRTYNTSAPWDRWTSWLIIESEINQNANHIDIQPCGSGITSQNINWM